VSLPGAKVRSVSGGRLMFWCPACDHPHTIPVGPGLGDRWQWDGSVCRPSVSESIKVIWSPADTDVTHVCHSAIVDGTIRFFSDSTHGLADRTVELPDMVAVH